MQESFGEQLLRKREKELKTADTVALAIGVAEVTTSTTVEARERSKRIACEELAKMRKILGMVAQKAREEGDV